MRTSSNSAHATSIASIYMDRGNRSRAQDPVVWARHQSFGFFLDPSICLHNPPWDLFCTKRRIKRHKNDHTYYVRAHGCVTDSGQNSKPIKKNYKYPPVSMGLCTSFHAKKTPLVSRPSGIFCRGCMSISITARSASGQPIHRSRQKKQREQ